MEETADMTRTFTNSGTSFVWDHNGGQIVQIALVARRNQRARVIISRPEEGLMEGTEVTIATIYHPKGSLNPHVLYAKAAEKPVGWFLKFSDVHLAESSVPEQMVAV